MRVFCLSCGAFMRDLDPIVQSDVASGVCSACREKTLPKSSDAVARDQKKDREALTSKNQPR